MNDKLKGIIAIIGITCFAGISITVLLSIWDFIGFQLTKQLVVTFLVFLGFAILLTKNK